MTGLLVSVRDAAEAQAAIRGGATLIDVKEPLHGSLGAASPEAWREIRRAVPAEIPCSAALGELKDVTPEQVANWRSSLAGYQLAKLGLSSCTNRPDWKCRWQTVLQALPPETGRVAVIYADWQPAGAPSPEEILRAASESSCSALLLDTFDKSRGSLTAHLSEKELSEILAAARAAGLTTVLAGSLTLALARELLPLAPDFVAVRGAVCRAGRAGTVEESLVNGFAEILLSTREGANHFSTPAKTIFAA
ncbi:MAG: (5-formylfuran-3-yl)methyl phosphate synthase [Planctomycetales bacterium]|nr:(5-formylfuran-3-yl)methyl phosphate synthase [Planctomycetales bacterium]